MCASRVLSQVDVLDRGYLKVVEWWGSDQRIIEAARMSTNKGFKGWGPLCPRCKQNNGWGLGGACLTEGCQGGRSEQKPGDEKLLAYLWRNKHATPFEMAGLTIEVQAPIFVFRQWHRHRTQSYNEMSARYVELPVMDYIPSVERLTMGRDEKNKQAQGRGGGMTADEALDFRDALSEKYALDEEFYQTSLQQGVPKELARIVLPVGRYSRMRASANLRNWLAFLTLRLDKHAQWEIRQYAMALAGFISHLFPRTYELFNE